MTRQEEKDEFIGILLTEFPSREYADVLKFARDLMRYARTDQTLAERACNQFVTPAEEKRQTTNQHRITSLCQAWGITPVFNGDPRGATVKLQVPSGRTNDWGQVGVCVPAGN